MIARFLKFLHTNNLVEAGDKIVLGVSGGLDSVVMVHLFSEIQSSLKLQLAVAHVHHGIREKEADADLEFVQSLAATSQLPFYFRKVAAKKYAKSQKLSLEESARILRYQAFEEVLIASGCDKLAMAHHANDQAETVIDHFLRGSGNLGMSGIPRRRGVFIRPLLEFTRKELENYANEKNLEFRDDSTNSDLQFRRNRIRHELIPNLEKHFNPDLVKTLNRVSQIYAETEEFLSAYADEAFQSLILSQRKNEIILDIEPFIGYFRVVKKHILFTAFEKLGVTRRELNFFRLDRLIEIIEQKRVGKRFEIKKDFELFVDHDGVVIRKKTRVTADKAIIELLNAKSKQFLDYHISWTILDNTGNIEFENDKTIELLDFEKTGDKLYLRSTQPGDKFIPLNFNGHKKVADYFSDRKIPHHVRESTPVLESSNGIVWICGFCIDDRFKVTRHTNKLLRLELKQHSNGA